MRSTLKRSLAWLLIAVMAFACLPDILPADRAALAADDPVIDYSDAVQLPWRSTQDKPAADYLMGDTGLGTIVYNAVKGTYLPAGEAPTATAEGSSPRARAAAASLAPEKQYGRVLSRFRLGLSDAAWQQDGSLRVSVTLNRAILSYPGERLTLVRFDGEKIAAVSCNFSRVAHMLGGFTFTADQLGEYAILGVSKHKPENCYVTFYGMDGTVIEDREVADGAPVGAFPEVPEPEGFIFTEWLGAEGVTAETVVTADLALTAAYAEMDYPEAAVSASANGLDVDISVPEGSLPADAEFQLVPVNGEDYRAAIEAAMGGEVGEIMAVDMSFRSQKGKKYQPKKAVTVSMALNGMADAERLTVVHITDDGKADVVFTGAPEKAKKRGSSKKAAKKGGADDPADAGETMTISFPASGFSVYAVVDPNSIEEKSRLTLNFYDKDRTTLVSTMFVKNSDCVGEHADDNLQTILFDPGMESDLDPYEIFLGWTEDQDYDASAESRSAVKTIKEIRDEIKALGANGSIAEGQTRNYYAMVLKNFTVTYYDPYGVSMGTHSVYITLDQNQADYQITMVYTPTDNFHNFEGWLVKNDTADHIQTDPPSDPAPDTVSITVDGQSETRTRYQFEANLIINGDVEFDVYAPEGNWLVFNENGKGAKYNAPQFVKRGGTTFDPLGDSFDPVNGMTRIGYDFGGWYTKLADGATADEHGYIAVDETKVGGKEQYKFEFGSELQDYTTVYAKWTPKSTAPYTIVFWTQNLSSLNRITNINEELVLTQSDYDLKASYVGTGAVGSNIPYTFRDNGSEDYVTVAGGTDYHYTGFCLQPVEQEVTITPEGDAVLNLYFKRIKYKFRFYYYRERNNSTNPYSAAQYSASYTGNGVYDVAQWYGWGNNRPSQTYGPDLTASVEGYTAHYFLLTAYYGQDISGLWPSYSQLSDYRSGNTDYAAVSFVMMNGTGLKKLINPAGTGIGKGSDTIKGLITIMDEMILGKTNDENGNFVVLRYSTKNTWQYHIFYEQIDGVDYSGKTVYTIDNVKYYEADIVDSRSTNQNVNEQNYPQYAGYDYVTLSNQTGQSGGDGGNNARWTTGSGNNQVFHVRYYYKRKAYPINYMDGTYFDGEGNIIEEDRREDPIYTSDDIEYEFPIPDVYKNYKAAPLKAGYVFEGWYADVACLVPYDFTSMPIGGIRVYAKWRQIQYRVFLHANDGTRDEYLLDWGSTNVKMSFRVDYGEKISLPTGTRFASGYELVGWFKDPNHTKAYSKDTRVIYNSESPGAASNDIFSDYDKNDLTAHATDPIDEWGEYGEGARTNTDLNRDWITKRVDLYALWHKIILGAEGINIEYDATAGGTFNTNNDQYYMDQRLYLDKAEAVAMPASLDPPKVDIETSMGDILHDQPKVFLYWVLQKWDGQKYVDVAPLIYAYPGDTFKVLMDNAKPVVTKWANPNNPENDIITVEHPSPGTTPPDEIHTLISEASYTVRVRAEYKMPENPTPTHIWWFPNYPGMNEENNTPDKHNKVYVSATVSDPDPDPQDADKMAINQSVYIKTPGTTGNSATTITVPDGYMFVGWARVDENKSKSLTNTDNYGKLDVQKNMFLYYHPADSSHASGYYTTDAAGENEVIGYVAADENNPIHDLYAIWAKLEVTKKVNGVSDDDKAYLTSDYNDKVKNHDFKYVVKLPLVELYLDNNGRFAATSVNAAKKFTVKAGASLGEVGKATELPNIGAGIYVFREVDDNDSMKLSGYTLDSSSTTEVANFSLSTSVSINSVAFQNIYTRDKGTLKVVKSTNPVAVDTGTQKFKVTIKNSAGKYLQSTTNITNASFGATAVEFDLGVGENNALTITGLPTDTYTVEEVGPESVTVQGYKYTSTSCTLTIAGETGSTASETTTITGDVKKDNKVTTATITNHYQQVVPVTVTKTVSGDLTEVPEGFKIATGNTDYPDDLTSTSQNVTYDAEIHKYTWTIPDVPVGTQFTFTESGYAVNNYDVAYQISVNGTAAVTSKTPNADSTTTPSAMLTVSGESSVRNTVDFVNTYTARTVNVKLTKDVKGNAANPMADYTFSVTSIAQDGQNLPIPEGWARFTLKDDQSKLFENVPIGAVVTIKETGVTGFTTTVDTTTGLILSTVTGNPDASGAETSNGERTFTFTATALTGEATQHEFTVTNTKSIPTPPTGLGLESTAYIVLMALALFGMVSGMAARKRRARR